MQICISPKEEIYLRFDVRDIRKTRLREILPGNLIALEQTNPPLGISEANRIILLTYRTNTGRIGFEVRIQEFTSDHRVIVNRLTDPAPCDLRFWPRIKLDLLPSARAFYRNTEIQIVDISGGGTHFILSGDSGTFPQTGETVGLKFIFAKDEISIDGEILRRWTDESKREHLAVQFLGSHDISRFIYR